jgi:putative heme iron utilization protein
VTEPSRLRELLQQERHGVLATLSARHGGWPFASATAYAIGASGEPLLLLSELAEHTRNVRADPRASLLVQDSAAADDPQAGARVTLLGTLELDDAEDARPIYVARHPKAEAYLQLGDFLIWRLNVIEARYVGGFGDMGWLTGERLQHLLAG